MAPGPAFTRPSDAERERAIEALRNRAVEGRISHDTFVGRVDRALRARHRGELDELVADLPPRGRLARRLTEIVESVSAFTARVEAAWRSPRLPRLPLPADGRTEVTIGRSRDCDLILTDLTVSRLHARLHLDGETWLLADLGSMNGTRVNGWRLTSPSRVNPGDEIMFGQTSFLLTSP